MTDETLYSALHWAKKAEYWAGQAAQGQIQADWNQSDNTKKDYIKNKPGINDLLPSQTGNSGKFLTTNGTASSWANITIPTVNNATLTIQQNGTTVDTFTANSSTNKTVNIKTEQFKLFHHGWFDYELNDQSWLRADTFSWQDGTVYSNAYNHLVADYNGGTSQTETVGSYTITYKLATDGHKITTDETNVVNIYNESGVAWYYILDQANQRFKLPRTKFGFTGLRDEVGKFVEAGLPNITGGFMGGGNNNSGAFGSAGQAPRQVAGGSGAYMSLVDFDASRSSLIYGNSTTVQPPATQMYLYFYVGQFSQSAIEQTAGVTTETLNGKTDTDAGNLSTAGKSLISGLGMPSGRYIDLTLGASGSTYTAPANGYFTLFGTLNSVEIYNNSSSNLYWGVNGPSNTWKGSSCPVKAGDVVTVHYSTYDSDITFKFIYAEGESNV